MISQPLLLIEGFENTNCYDLILSLMTVTIKPQNINLCMEDAQNYLIYIYYIYKQTHTSMGNHMILAANFKSESVLVEILSQNLY
jgi:hypothetical protein